jgi:hypothetical protein
MLCGMLATMAVPLVVLIVGALAFALATNPKVARMGELAFFVGLFFAVWILSHQAVHF